MTAAFIALDDLDRVILDNRVGEQSLASLAEHRTRAAAILAIDLDVEDLSLSHALDALDGERPQRPLDRLALRIEHPGFERDGNARFQRLVSGGSGGVRRGRHGQERIERRRIARRAQLRCDRRIAQEPRAHRQRLQVIRARRLRGYQHEDEVDRQPVRRLEVYGALEAGEDAENLFALGELAMGYGDAVADAGGSKALALQQRIEDFARRKPRNERCAFAHFLQRLLLAIYTQR